MMNFGEAEFQIVEFWPGLPYQGAFFLRTYQHYWYAIHRPSGENIGCLSLNRVCRNTSGFSTRSPELKVSTCTVQMSDVQMSARPASAMGEFRRRLLRV
jgi:hypothetical protein